MSGRRFAHTYPWQILSRHWDLRLTHRLPGTFDADKLQHECREIMSRYRLRDQHGDDHKGGWKAIGLISPDGDPYEDRNLASRPHLKTKALESAPYIESVIDSLGCRMHRVRLMQLLPDEKIMWHADATESIDRLHARVHIPVFTNPDVHFQLSHEDCTWPVGELWYGDFSFPHRLHNRGSTARIHIVLDLLVDDHVRGMFSSSFLENGKARESLRPWIHRMMTLYTLPRYKLASMRRSHRQADAARGLVRTSLFSTRFWDRG